MPEDYKEGLKIRKLKPTAVPSVFPQYPSYKQPCLKKPRKAPKQRAENTGGPAEQQKRSSGAPKIQPLQEADENRDPTFNRLPLTEVECDPAEGNCTGEISNPALAAV
ncbi:uncharacterized protein LOC135390504 [Ornithodoros turicata]|uniref:uncharacterized protein LOC135390504 n=1 Tax=Ornithodoros turicata TaxID=34597 RepID=UPI003138C447